MSYTPKIPARGRLHGAVLAAATIACLGLPTDRAEAMDAMLSFNACTNNSATSVAIAEAQMSVNVSDVGGGKVRFDLLNAGPAASSITDVYFDDNGLLSSLSLIDTDDGVGGHGGVDFSPGASPGELPGANDCTPTFTTTAGLLADSDEPPPINGVNPDEFLGIVFDLNAGKSYADVLADLESGALRVGIHVQGFANNQSEGLVSAWNGTTTEVPEPGALAMFGFGMVGLVVARRRRQGGLLPG